MSIPFIRERILPFFANVSIHVNMALQIGTEFQARRRARIGILPHNGWKSVQLRNWISSSTSSCIQIKGLARHDGSVTDFAIEFIRLCKTSGVPIIWYLHSTSITSDSTSGIEIIRTFVFQIVEQHETPCAGWKLNEGDFQTCTSYEGWVQILVALLREMPKIVVVIDSCERQQVIVGTLRNIQATLKAENVATTMKILVTTHGTHDRSVLLTVDGDDAGLFQVSLDPSPGFRHSPVPARVLTRRYGALRNHSGSQPRDLEPFIKDFMA